MGESPVRHGEKPLPWVVVYVWILFFIYRDLELNRHYFYAMSAFLSYTCFPPFPMNEILTCAYSMEVSLPDQSPYF